LEKNIDILDRNDKSEMNTEGEYLYLSALTTRQVFENRKIEFYAVQKEYTWLSWNIADQEINKSLQKSIHLSALN
jgi:hypothetical protein